jgi:hypothetical protein
MGRAGFLGPGASVIKIHFSLRLVLCANGVPVGPRLERDRPLPRYEHTYDDTPEGRALAERDRERFEKYIEDYEKRR